MLALLDLREHLDHVERPADLDFKVTEACQEMQGSQVFLELRVNKDHQELDFLARLVPKDSLEFQAPKGYLGSQEDQERMARLEILVHLDKKVKQDGVSQVQRVSKACQELLVSQGRRVTLDFLAFLGEKDRRDHLDIRVLKVISGPQDLLDRLAIQVLLEKALLELQGHKDHLDSLDHMVAKV